MRVWTPGLHLVSSYEKLHLALTCDVHTRAFASWGQPSMKGWFVQGTSQGVCLAPSAKCVVTLLGQLRAGEVGSATDTLPNVACSRGLYYR